MQQRIRVRRERPSALSWAVALAVTMLAVWLITLDARQPDRVEDAAAGVRVTRQVDLDGLTVHFADLGGYATEWEARVAAAEYTLRGAAGVVRSHEGAYRLLGAGYRLEADAKRIAARLGEQEGVEAGVLTLSAPAAALRVTASEKDVEAIAEADFALRQQLDQLSAMALQVDRDEISFASARTLARVAASELRKARKRLEEIPGSADQPVCAAMIGQLRALEENIAAVTGGLRSGAELSGQLRCCHVDGTLRLIDFLNGLAGG